MINVDGSGERPPRAGTDTRPSGRRTGTRIIFLRGDQVIRVELAGGGAGRESVLLDGPRTEGIEGGMETPELSPDGARLAVTVRSSQYGGVAVVDLATRAVTRLSPGQACQITWMRGSDALLWMETQGNGGTQIVTGGPGRPRGLFMDLPGATATSTSRGSRTMAAGSSGGRRRAGTSTIAPTTRSSSGR